VILTYNIFCRKNSICFSFIG